MHTPSEFLTTYQHMTDGQLLQVANEGGLVPEAQLALTEELHRRNLKKSDLAQHRPSARERLESESRERWFPLVPGRKRSATKYPGSHQILRLHNPTHSHRLVSVQMRFQWNTQYRVLNRVPLNWDQVFLTWAKTAAWIIGIFAAVALYVWVKVNHE